MVDMGIINIFKKGTRQLTGGVDTWMVEWESYREGIYNVCKDKHFQAFISEEEAREFKKDLERAHELLSNQFYTVRMTKQKSGL